MNNTTLIDLLRQYCEVSHHYRGDGGKLYVHMRCGDPDNLRFLVDICTASNNQMLIQADDKGFYYTLIVYHNYDILRSRLEGGR